MIALAIAAFWLLANLICIALCRSSARGDSIQFEALSERVKASNDLQRRLNAGLFLGVLCLLVLA